MKGAQPMGETRLEKRSRERGSNLVEMALVLFILVLLIIAVADFGRAFNNYIIITNAAREGAREGSYFPDVPSRITNAAIREAANSGLTLTASNITVELPNGTAPGNTIRVIVETEFDTIIGGMVGARTLTLRNATEMVIFGRQ